MSNVNVNESSGYSENMIKINNKMTEYNSHHPENSKNEQINAIKYIFYKLYNELINNYTNSIGNDVEDSYDIFFADNLGSENINLDSNNIRDYIDYNSSKGKNNNNDNNYSFKITDDTDLQTFLNSYTGSNNNTCLANMVKSLLRIAYNNNTGKFVINTENNNQSNNNQSNNNQSGSSKRKKKQNGGTLKKSPKNPKNPKNPKKTKNTKKKQKTQKTNKKHKKLINSKTNIITLSKL